MILRVRAADGGIVDETTGQKIASDAMVAVTVAVLAIQYIHKKMAQVKAAMLYDCRKAR